LKTWEQSALPEGVKVPYPDEFKAEAIRLVKSSGDPIRQSAKDLGVSDQTLRN
jgi:transposase-like protein